MKIAESILTAVLSPSAGNPRNSEGSFIRLSNGRIAFAYSRYIGDSYHDHARCNIAVIYSENNGNTWDTAHPQTLVDAADYGAENVMSVSLTLMNNGDIGLFFLIKHPGPTSHYLLRRYRGDFQHFVSETTCFPGPYDAYFVVNNDRVLPLRDGRFIIPAAYHQTSVCPKEGQQGYFDSHASVFTFTSRDDGATWTQNSGKIHLHDPYSHTGLQEPGLLELPGGILYGYSRTDRMYQYESVSLDQGAHWFAPQPSAFAAPASPMQIKQNPHSGRYYAVWNPNPITLEHPYAPVTMGRTPLALAESMDGVHFGTLNLIETDPSCGYCYPAMYFLSDSTLLLSYCNGGAADKLTLNSTAIRKLTLDL